MAENDSFTEDSFVEDSFVEETPKKKVGAESSAMPVLQGSEPSVQSGVKDSEPIDLPKSYQDDRGNYKDLVGGSKYNLLRGGKPVTGTWDEATQTFIKDPLLNATPQRKKEVGFLQAVEAGVNLEAPVETQEEIFGRLGVEVDELKKDAKEKLSNIDYITSYPSVQRLGELEKIKNSTEDAKVIEDIDRRIAELRSKKMSDKEFEGIRFDNAEGKVYQNFLPAKPVEEFKGDVKKLPKTDMTVGQAYDEVKDDSDYIQQVQGEIKGYGDMVNQYMIGKLPEETKLKLEALKGTPEYDTELEKELVQSKEVENIIPALAYGLDKKLDALMEVGSNIGLDDDRLIQKKLGDIREKQMFGKNMATTRAEIASSIGGMLPDIAAGGVYSPLMLASMASTMPNDFLEQSIAEQSESGLPIDVNKAKKFALTSTAAQTAMLVGAGKVGAHGLNLVGKTGLKRAGELIYEMAKRGTKDAIVFGGLGTVMQNKINKAYDLAENDEYLKQGLHMAIIGGMFALKEGIGKVKGVSKKTQNEVDYLASYLPEEYTRKQVEQLTEMGKISPADGEETLGKLNTIRAIRNQIPTDLTVGQMDKIYPMWVERRRLQSMTKDASSEFKSVLNGEVEDIDRKILVKAAVPLTSSERAEKNKLSTAEAENKDIDKSRLRYLEQRDEAAKEVNAEKKIEEAKIQADAELAELNKKEASAKETKPEDSMLSEGESKLITNPEIEAKKAKLKVIKEGKKVGETKTQEPIVQENEVPQTMEGESLTSEADVKQEQPDGTATPSTKEASDYEKAKSNFDAVKEKHKKFLTKKGTARTNMPESVKNELDKAWSEVAKRTNEERQRLVDADKTDNGLSEGFDAIRGNRDAFNLVSRAWRFIPERQYNEFGKQLKHTLEKEGDNQLMEVAEIIQDFTSRDNVKLDDTVAREIQKAENAKYDEGATFGGKEIQPNEAVKTDLQTVIDEVKPPNLSTEDATALYEMKDAPQEVVYSSTRDSAKEISDRLKELNKERKKEAKKKNPDEAILRDIDTDIEVETKDFNEQSAVEKQEELANKGFIELDDKSDNYVLSDRGKEFIKAVEARTETRRQVKAGTDMFPELANIPEIEKAKAKVKEASAKAKKVRSDKNNLGVADDPFEQAKREAEADRELFDAYVDLAKEYVKYGVKTVEDFAKQLGEEVTDVIKKAWESANGDIIPNDLGDGVKKTIVTKRAYEGEFREGVKKELEKIGLTREIESQAEAKAKAIQFVDSVGEETALEAVRNNDVSDASGAYVWNELIERNEKKILTEKNPERISELEAEQARLIEEFGVKATSGGRFAAALGDIYEKSDLGYNLQKKISDYKAQNGGEIPAEVEAKFREWDKQLKEVKTKLAEAEQRAKEAEEKQAVSDIKESVEREKKSRKTYEQKARVVANEIRKLKNKPFQFKDENGNLVDVTTMGVTWNDIVETVAKGVEAGGKLADVISSALEDVEWYKNFSDKDKEAFKKQLSEHLSKEETTEGKLKIPHSLIRDFVERGIDNIEDLTKAVHEVVKETNPDATEREVRDAITGYGKTVNPNMEQVEVDIRKMKRIGRITSALEDVAAKKRPLRSGQQRDKLDAQERALNKELREAMKDLPVDAETEAQQLKTSLDAVKQRLQNQIEDLNREIETGEKTPVSERKIEYDSEAKALAEERDRVKAIHDEIFGKTELTDEQRINIATKALEKSISNLEEKLKTGDILPKKAESKTPETPELKALREKRDKLQEEIRELRDATKVKKSPQEIATENAIEANRKSIEEKERRIRENDLSPTPKKEVADKNNAELKALRTKNEALDKQLQKLRNDAKVKRDASIVATEAAIKSIERRTKDIQDRIRNNELEKAKKPSLVKNTPEYQKAKKKLEAEAEKLKKLQEAAGIPDKKRVELAKKAAERRIEDLQRRLRDGDFSKKKSTPLQVDSELIKLRAEKLRIKEEYEKEFYKAKLKNRTTAEKIKDSVWELWAIPRVLMATGEMSFVGIQGLKQSVAHPLTAARAFKNALTFMKSEKNADNWLRNIKSQEWYPTLRNSKLALTEPHAELSAREELFYSGWSNLVWDGLGRVITSPARLKSADSYLKAQEGWSKLNPLKALERGAVGYLDTIRVERFLSGAEMLKEQGKTFENSPQDYKDVADAINTMTGRASLGGLEQQADLLSKVFFSPRNWASGIKTATPYALIHFGKMTPTARKMAISDFSKFVGLTTGMVMMAAAKLNNDDDKETGVEFDPRSTDFMKIKLGNKRVDPWGGMQQQVVFSSRIIADGLMRAIPQLGIEGGYKKGGDIMPLGISHKSPSAGKLLGQQALNKLNPTADLLYNYLNTTVKKDGTRVNDFGQEYTVKSELGEKFHPIFWSTVSELLKDDPNALNGLLAFYAFFGGGVSIYDSKPKK